MIHSTAIIDKSVQIDPSAEIGPYAVIGPKTIIKSNVVVHPHAVIEYSEIGSGCRIFSGASVGCAPQDLKYNDEETKLIVGDNTIIREFATLNRGTASSGVTKIGARCLFMAYSHVAHDCIIGNQVILANSVALAGHVRVDDDVILGGLVGVHQFVHIGRSAMIGAGSMIPLDVPPYVLGSGDRMKLVGINIIGLKRKKLTNSKVQAIKNAYRTLFLSDRPINESILLLRKYDQIEEVQEMICFVENSKRGICSARTKNMSVDQEQLV
ncbi:MAG: acyl-ACP--UDP-N-acetylglucosamine O-acyltransferase [bacterium]